MTVVYPQELEEGRAKQGKKHKRKIKNDSTSEGEIDPLTGDIM